MTFNAPPPPPPSPEFSPEPIPPKKGKLKGILVAVLVVLLLALAAVAAFWFMNQKEDAPAASQPAAPVVTESTDVSPTPVKSAPASGAAAESPATESTEAAASASGKWTKKATEPPTSEPSDSSHEPSTQPSEVSSFYSSSRQEEMTGTYCSTGKIILFAQTSKHYVSICQDGNSLSYRGVGKASGNPITLSATDMGGGHYRASNRSSNTTTYDIDRDSLTVTTSNSGVILDSSVTGYETFD